MTSRLLTRATKNAIYLVALLCIVLAASIEQIAAQQTSRQTPQQSASQNSSTTKPKPFAANVNVDPSANASFIMRFRRTELDSKAEGIAQVEVGAGRLSVRVMANNLPLPSHWRQEHYSVWVSVPNYGYKMYIGDLPVTADTNELKFVPVGYEMSRESKKDEIERGNSDTSFIFNNLPKDAVFGGLILTAEPPKYSAIINEPLRPVLVALAADGDIEIGSLEARAIKRISPVYSEILRRAGTIGNVRVFIEIDGNGNVMNVTKATGPQLLRNSATDAVRQWKFQPLLVCGQRVRAKGFVEFNFFRKF